jgi:hypothetical protein
MPGVDLSPAAKFGKLQVLLPPEGYRLPDIEMTDAVREGMQSCGPLDWLVAIGSPSILAVAACIAAKQTGGLLRLLTWDKRANDYLPFEVRV